MYFEVPNSSLAELTKYCNFSPRLSMDRVVLRVREFLGFRVVVRLGLFLVGGEDAARDSMLFGSRVLELGFVLVLVHLKGTGLFFLEDHLLTCTDSELKDEDHQLHRQAHSQSRGKLLHRS